jgi:Cdc6-like AAA superfamily ATPase
MPVNVANANPTEVQDKTEVYPLLSREHECRHLDSFLQQSLSHGAGRGKSLYISGGPGTGKTCSARASIRHWKKQAPDTFVLEVNCMDLAQRSVTGVLQQLLAKMGQGRMASHSVSGLAAAVVSNFARTAGRIVLVVDEVDQLAGRGNGNAGAISLETLFSLPRLPGAPAMAIIAIANAVDLLERIGVHAANLGCDSLLFTPYTKDQLKNIVTSRIKAVKGGDSALRAMGPVKIELRVRQAAKERGDCRQVLSLIEEAHFEAKLAHQAELANASSTESKAELCSSNVLSTQQAPKRVVVQSSRNDPLQSVKNLPLEQQMLLSVLASAKQEAVKISELCARYRDLCRSLHQPVNLGSKSQVSTALSALEQRGLLEVRVPRVAGRSRAKLQSPTIESIVELSVACDVLRKEVVQAMPVLERYMS